MPIGPTICVLVALAGSVATPGRGAPTASPDPGGPSAAIQSLVRAYSDRSVEGYAALLTADYRFHFSSNRASDVGVFVNGFTREHELRSASALFHGVVREGRVVKPGAEAITATLDGLSEGPDPEHPDSMTHYRVVAVRNLELGIRLAAGDTIGLSPALHVFHLVRGDVAVRAAGQPAEQGRWYVRRWLEDVEGLRLVLAENRGPCGEPAPRPGAQARSEGSTGPAGAPADLAIHPLGNPACATVELACDLPGSEPALVEVFDVMGRRMNRRDLANPAPGTVRVEAGAGARIVPGVYWVRLSQGARRPTTTMVVVAR
jgi:hypothetical protein